MWETNQARKKYIGNFILDVRFASVASTEPVTLTEVKAYANIDFPDWDVLIEQTMITAAREAVEEYCNISLVEKSVVALIQVESDQLLPYGPIKATPVMVIKDEAGVVTTSAVKRGLDFVHILTPGVYQVEYDTGYESVPKALKQAIMAKVLAGFENRGDKVVQKYDSIFKQLATPYMHKL